MTQTLSDAGEVLTGAAGAAAALQETTAWKPSGYGKRMLNEAHVKRVFAARKLFVAAANGDRYAMLQFKEAMSTSDFPIAFGDSLYRSLVQRYAQAKPVWQMFAARRVVRDFRPNKLIDVFGAGATLDPVPERAPYPERAMSESSFTITTGKKGARLDWSWEMQINDDLGAFARGPQDLARGAVNTEDKTATSILTSASGPQAALFPSPDNKPLNAANLEAAMQTIASAVDGDGNPIDIGTPILVVPKALSLTAQNIAQTTQVRTQTGTGSGSTLTDIAGNGLSETPKIVTNRWLTAIDKDAKAPTTWYLLPAPDSIRPAVIVAFLAGYETPDLRLANNAGVHPGGGAVDPSEGSFENDSVGYRVRHVVGGNTGFTDACYASTGS